MTNTRYPIFWLSLLLACVQSAAALADEYKPGIHAIELVTSPEPTFSQTLHMAVGDTLRPRLAAGGQIQKWIESRETSAEIIEELFVLTLSCRPTADEVTAMQSLVGDATGQSVYEDILWGLLNSTEFSFNH